MRRRTPTWSRAAGFALAVALLVLAGACSDPAASEADEEPPTDVSSGAEAGDQDSSTEVLGQQREATDEPSESEARSEDAPSAPDDNLVPPAADDARREAYVGGGQDEPGAIALGPSDELSLEHVTTIRGEISPKSVVASDTGVYVAQNMMYRHTITVYDDEHELVATIPDQVRLEEFGIDGPGEPVRGAPVEADFSPDGAHAYITNYSMYGPGFARQGSDSCGPDDGIDESFVYRVDAEAMEIDQVIPVGAVPKVVKVTPDGRYVLVTNWCSYDLSIIDAATGREVERVDIGRYPRGVAIDADSSTAYVAVMGSSDVAMVDLSTVGSGEVELGWLRDVGRGPRDLVLSPDGRYLFVTLNREGVLARVDLANDGVVEKVATGDAPRSMAMAADGRSLYLVNYHSDTVSKVATENLEVLQQIPVDDKPIGITYDDRTGEVWVACYSGSIIVFQDT